jgi:hypothetical protein
MLASNGGTCAYNSEESRGFRPGLLSSLGALLDLIGFGQDDGHSLRMNGADFSIRIGVSNPEEDFCVELSDQLPSLSRSVNATQLCLVAFH